jgi:hypothetical protein
VTSLVSDLSATDTAVITIKAAEASNGASLTGMNVVVTSNGKTVASGTMPLNFTGVLGKEYSVEVNSSGNNIFQHWDDNLSNLTRTFTMTQTRTFTAYYGPPPKQLIGVHAITVSGTTLTGMRAVVQSNGVTVASGFTPFDFYGNPGTLYTVIVSNYGEYQFTYWNNWSSNPARVITLQQSTSMTAVYNTCPCRLATNNLHGGNNPVPQ